MKSFKQVLLASAVALALGSTAAHAGTVSSLFIGGQNSASDEDREYLINRGGGATTVDIGDSLRGFIGINTLNSGSANIGGVTPNNEWTAVFQAIVTGKTNLGGGFYNYTFGPDAAFAANLCGGTAVAGCSSSFVPGVGAMAVMFEGSVHNFNLDGTGLGITTETKGSTATDGAWFWTLGFSGIGGTAALGEGWTAFTLPGLGDDVANAANFTTATLGGGVNAGLSCLASGIGDCSKILATTPDIFGGPAQFALTGNIKGISGLNTTFQVSSDTTFAFNHVPEPGTLGLLGAALFGFGALGLRRKA